MTRDIPRRRLLVAAGCLALLGSSSLGRGEVTKTGEPTPRPRPAQVTLVPAQGLELRAECWQHGVKIIDQAGLEALSLDTLTRDQAVSFKRRADTHPSVFLLPFQDGLCLIQPNR